MSRLQATIAQAQTVHSGPDLVVLHAQLRVECELIGHALGAREHNADRWIAATALRLNVPSSPTTGSSPESPGFSY
jgi:hypothetical protein